jgi:hypothetical protein
MVDVDELAKEIYIHMIIRDDINVANPGARLLAAQRAEGAYALADIFASVSEKRPAQSSHGPP